MKNKKLTRDLIEKLEDYNSRDLFEYHVEDIRNLVYDYMSKTKDYSLEDIMGERFGRYAKTIINICYCMLCINDERG